ncbi:MAG: hypothetical protein U5J63_18290 [Fodinibius sp.]|nr:hypothetical protein [Fodinibius sp.]
MPSEQELKQRQAEQARQDSIAAAQADTPQTQDQPSQQQAQQQTQQNTESDRPTGQTLQADEEEQQEMGMFSAASVTDTTELVVETPLYSATFTNVGGGPAQITFKDYETWNHKPVKMIDDTTQSAYSLGFLTSENYQCWRPMSWFSNS